MKKILEELLDGGLLSRSQTRHLFDRLADPAENPVCKGAVLALLRRRGETAEELTGIVEGMLDAAKALTMTVVDLPPQAPVS